MQALRKMHALLIVCALILVAALAAMRVADSTASAQMAAKRQISLQLRQDMEMCEDLDGDDADLCMRQAHGWAEMAKQELQALRKRNADVPKANESRLASHDTMAQTCLRTGRSDQSAAASGAPCRLL